MVRQALWLLRGALRAIQLTLPKLGIGWMFALLTSNFNRIAIHELGVLAVLVTSMIGLYHFLSPFQVYFGRLADRHPILGFRRSPYLLLGLALSALVFPALPSVAVAMGEGSVLAVVTGFVLLTLFGIGFAAAGNAHLALIADLTSERSRGIVVALVWTVQIAAVIISASIMKQVMPVYDPAAMQTLYNLTLPIVLISTIVALLGTEPRLRPDHLHEEVARANAATPRGNALHAIVDLLRGSRPVRYFFGFIIFSTLGVFLQDTILEVFGAEVLGMSVKETTSFQQVWGGAVLASMLLVGAITAARPINRRLLAAIGGVGTTAGLLLLACTAVTSDRALLYPALALMGLFTGLYTLGALSTMMELTTAGATATYMGLWGLAQALGNGLSSVSAGALHSALIDSHVLAPGIGYGAIFGIEAVLMFAGVVMLSQVSLAAFRQRVTHTDMARTMEMEAA